MSKNGRLVLMQRQGDSIFFDIPDGLPAGSEMEINVVKIQGAQVNLAITAPKEVRIVRSNAKNKKARKVVDKSI